VWISWEKKRSPKSLHITTSMALPNPTIDPPHLPAATRRSLHTRSPSRSPVRRHHSVRDLDPLLRDLSPTATLRAFTSQPEKHEADHLSRSVESASLAQRRLGIQAAQSCLDLRAWARELGAWEWPGTFDEPEPARKKQRMSVMSIGSVTSQPSISQRDSDSGQEFWGSLPAQTAQAYQRRLDEITEDLEEVDVEGLKAFVLSAHSQAGYGKVDIDDSIGAIGADTNLKRLDDFTALVTATILQSLPYLSRLHRLLSTWSTRLSILRSASSFLRDLAQAHTDLDHGWAALAVSSHPAAADALQRANATFSRETMLEMKTVVQKLVSSLGGRLDQFLDMLEGREECVPDAWIEDFETLEEQYGQWVVQAERKVLDGEWKASTPKLSEPDVAGFDVRNLYGPQDVPNGANGHVPVQSMRSVTIRPTVVSTTASSAGKGATSNMTTHTTSSGPQSTTITTATPSSSTQTRTATAQTTTNSNRSSTVQSTSSTSSSTKKHRSRHVPIDIDSYHDEYANAIANGAILELPATTSRNITPDPMTESGPANDAETSSQTVKKRAAFLNGDIEKSERLNKSKPAPIVRPFEHASNAFTRLFKRDRDEEKADGGSRSSSVGSRGSKKVEKKSSRSKMGYADLFSVPTSSEDTNEATSPDESRQRTPRKVDSRVMEYVDNVRMPARSSSARSKQSSRPTTPRQSTYPTDGLKSRARSMSSRSRRSSKQNITALPTKEPEPPMPTYVGDGVGPETYLPTDLSSPFHSPTEPEPFPDLPEDWPLPGSVTPGAEAEDPMTARALPEKVAETDPDVSKEPLSTEMFENLFVSSMPLSPHRAVTSGINAANEKETRFGQFGSYFQGRTPNAFDEDDTFFRERPSPDRTLLRTGTNIENLRLDDFEDSSFPRPVSMAMEDDEDTVDEDDIETAEIETARRVHSVGNAAAYFGGSGPSTPLSSAKKPPPSGLQRSMSIPPVSPRLLKLKIPSSNSLDEYDSPEVGRDEDVGLIRRASLKSIEAFPRSSLKSIRVVGPRSQPQTPLDSTPASLEQARSSMEPFTPTSPLHYKDDLYFPSPPSVPPRRSSLSYSPETRRSVEGRNSIERGRNSFSPDELNKAMAKSKRKKAENQDPRRSTESSKQRDTPPKKRASPLKPGEDNFDRHVSEVLDSVQASNIKFRTRPGAMTPLPSQRVVRKSSSLKPAQQPMGNMTLAPADQSPKKSAAADKEVKLYHLMQAGRSEPIKLFVRLVGEGERVMVRVGGGWADLADYLRQYAEHHGSRTVSEGGLQVQTAALTNGHGKRTFSGPAASLAKPSQRATPVTPLTALPVDERPSAKDGESEWLGSEQPRFTMGESDESASPSPLVAQQAGTWKPTSRPSTAQSAKPFDGLSTPLAESSPAGSLGMAGPASSTRSKADLPEQKARWVEGMIERVNASASAEKSREKQFADIGKVGGTRRVVFRKGSTGAGPGG